MKTIKNYFEKKIKLRKHNEFVKEYSKNGNKVTLIKGGKEILNPIIKGLIPKFEGKNGKIIIHHSINRMENLVIRCGDDSVIEIEESKNYFLYSTIL